MLLFLCQKLLCARNFAKRILNLDSVIDWAAQTITHKEITDFQKINMHNIKNKL